MRKDYDIVGSYNNQRVSGIDAERTVNLFEYLDPKAKKKKVLLPTSGLKNTNLNFTPETQGFRAEFIFNNQHFVVIGASVFLIQANQTYSRIGMLGTSVGEVRYDANTYQVIFVDGILGWIWDINSETFTQITDSNFPLNPVDVCNLDGFFVVAHGGTNNFQLSSFEQGMVWGGFSSTFTESIVTDLLTMDGSSTTSNLQTGIPITFSSTVSLPFPLNSTDTFYSIRISNTTIKVATSYLNAINGIAVDLTILGIGTKTVTVVGQLQQGTINSHPGNIIGCRTLHRKLFFFSENFTEVWENAGVGTNLPFRRNNSMLLEVGTRSLGSIAVGFDRMFFLSQDKDGLGAIMEVRGSEAIPASTRALDYQLAQYASNPEIGVEDAKGFLVKENGIIFYRLNFTKANKTFILNISMSDPENLRWHEEEILNGDRHPAQTHAYFNGINYYGDYRKPILYIVDNTISDNDGESIRRMRIGEPVVDEAGRRIKVNRWQLDLLQGIPEFLESEEVEILTEDGLNFLTTENRITIITQSEFKVPSDENPEVFLSISKDGGQTYGYKQKAPMGKVGDRTFRTVWRKLPVIPRGQAFVPKIEFFNKIPFVVLGAVWDLDIQPE